MEFDIEICHAWAQAAADLGIRVTTPFTLIDNTGKPTLFEAHIPDFGGPKGAVVGNKESDDEHSELRKRHGYFSSNLYESYRRYDRELFIDTLNDWGWFGEKGKEPSWYTGKPWS